MNFGRSQVGPVERLLRDERLVTNEHVLAALRNDVRAAIAPKTRAPILRGAHVATIDPDWMRAVIGVERAEPPE